MLNEVQVLKTANDVTIFADGSAFISQRKLAQVLGVNANTLMSYVSRTHQNTNTINGLSVEIVEAASTYYAFDTANPTAESKAFAKAIMKAGAKAYLYHEAGYVMQATPRTFSEALLLAGRLESEKEAALAQVDQLKIELDASMEWLSIKKVADFNSMSWKAIDWNPLKANGVSIGKPAYKVFDANFPDGVNVYHRDSWRAVYKKLKLPGEED